MLAGGAVTVIGCIVPWLTFSGGSLNGFDEFLGLDDNPFETQTPGPMFVLIAVTMAAFGVTTLAAKRLLPIMIVGIVIGAFSLLAALVELDHYGDYATGGTSLGAGLPIVAVGSAAALAGAITGCSKRRRWR